MLDYEKVLKDYIDDESDQLALQFNGSWGSGKTYFIEKFITKQKKSIGINGGHIYVSVSVNGVGNIDEFKQRLTEKLIAELIKNDDSTQKLALRALSTASNVLSSDGFNLILNIAGANKTISATKDVGKNVVNNFANKLLAKISQQQLVIVVDDFERITNVDTSRAVLGELLENYIHQQGAKVILISSEQNIMDDSNNEGSQQDKGNQNMGVASWFQEVREKYIGRLIRYSPDYEATLKSVANDILERQNDPYFSKYSTSLVEPLVKIGKKLNESDFPGLDTGQFDKLKNLRHSQRAIHQYVRFFRTVTQYFKDLDDEFAVLERLQTQYLPIIFTLSILDIEARINGDNISELIGEYDTLSDISSRLKGSDVEEHKLWEAYQNMATPLLSVLQADSEISRRPMKTPLLPLIEKPIINYLIFGQQTNEEEKFFKEVVDTTQSNLTAEHNRIDTLYSISSTWFKVDDDQTLMNQEREILCSFEKDLSTDDFSVYSRYEFDTWVDFLIATAGKEKNGWLLSPYIYEYHLSRIFLEVLNRFKPEDQDPKEFMHWYRYEDSLSHDEMEEVKSIFQVTSDVWTRSQMKDSEQKLLQLISKSIGPYRDYIMTVDQVDFLAKSIDENPQNFNSEFYWRIRFAFDKDTLYNIRAGNLPEMEVAINKLIAAMRSASLKLAKLDNTRIKRQNIERGISGKNGLETILTK